MATVLVTGASRGIGLATALAFAHAGHRMAAGMRNPDGAPFNRMPSSHERRGVGGLGGGAGRWAWFARVQTRLLRHPSCCGAFSPASKAFRSVAHPRRTVESACGALDREVPQPLGLMTPRDERVMNRSGDTDFGLDARPKP